MTERRVARKCEGSRYTGAYGSPLLVQRRPFTNLEDRWDRANSNLKMSQAAAVTGRVVIEAPHYRSEHEPEVW